MLNFYWILFLVENVLDYEKIDVRIQSFKRHKLNPLTPKMSQKVFRFRINLGVAPNFVKCDGFIVL